MSWTSKISALEIYTNVYDLSIVATKEVVMISRGPGHNYKIILSGEWKLEDQKSAAKEVEKILNAIIEVCEKDLSDSENLIAQLVNPDQKPLAEASVLTKEMVKDIVQILGSAEKGGVEVGTYHPPFLCCGSKLQWNTISPRWYNYQIEQAICSCCGKLYQRKDKNGVLYAKGQDGFHCSKCNGEINAIIIKHTEHDGPFPLSGSGKVQEESVPYCERCEKTPEDTHGKFINKYTMS